MHALNKGLVEAPETERDRMTASFRFGWIPWLITTVIAFYWPTVSLAGIALLTIYWMVFPGLHRRSR
jgi:hypothetical protein